MTTKCIASNDPALPGLLAAGWVQKNSYPDQATCNANCGGVPCNCPDCPNGLQADYYTLTFNSDGLAQWGPINGKTVVVVIPTTSQGCIWFLELFDAFDSGDTFTFAVVGSAYGMSVQIANLTRGGFGVYTQAGLDCCTAATIILSGFTGVGVPPTTVILQPGPCRNCP
jgi:hypothetical protein